MKFSRRELNELAIAWLILSFCFSLGSFFISLGSFPLFFGISFIGLGTGFICHELAHKLVVQRMSYFAEFRLWWWGLLGATMFGVI